MSQRDTASDARAALFNQGKYPGRDVLNRGQYVIPSTIIIPLDGQKPPETIVESQPETAKEPETAEIDSASSADIVTADNENTD